MIRFILLSVLLTIVLRIVLRVVREAVRSYRGIEHGGRPGQHVPPRGVPMVRDPVCGTFVVPDRARSLTVGGERLHFCSSTCLDRYRAEHPIDAASRGRTA